MIWQYRCGSPREMKFISVVCGLAVIQKQPRLVDRAFNRASPSHFPEPAFQAVLQTSASPPVSHFWLLPFPPTHSPALSLFPNPAFLTEQAALIYPLLCGLHYLSPQKPWHLFTAFDCSVQGLSCSIHMQHFAQGNFLPGESQATHISHPMLPQVTHLQALPWIKAVAKPQSCQDNYKVSWDQGCNSLLKAQSNLRLSTGKREVEKTDPTGSVPHHFLFKDRQELISEQSLLHSSLNHDSQQVPTIHVNRRSQGQSGQERDATLIPIAQSSRHQSGTIPLCLFKNHRIWPLHESQSQHLMKTDRGQEQMLDRARYCFWKEIFFQFPMRHQ